MHTRWPRDDRTPLHETGARRRQAGRRQLPAHDRRARHRARHLCRPALLRLARRRGAPGRRAARSGHDPHALSARAQRLPAHRPRQEHLPEFRPGARLRRRLPPALRRHQPREGRAGVRRRDPRRGAVARLRLGARRTARAAPLLRQRLLRLHVPRGRVPDRAPAWPTSTSRAPRRCAPPAATSTRPAPTARSAAARRPRTWRASARCATASWPTARPCCARRSTWRRPNINMRDPALYRIKPRDAPQHRRQVVHLPDVHLRAPDRGRAGEHHAQHLHAGVRGPAAVLRLAAGPAGRRRPAGAAAPAPVRIRAAEPDLRRSPASAS